MSGYKKRRKLPVMEKKKKASVREGGRIMQVKEGKEESDQWLKERGKVTNDWRGGKKWLVMEEKRKRGQW